MLLKKRRLEVEGLESPSALSPLVGTNLLTATSCILESTIDFGVTLAGTQRTRSTNAYDPSPSRYFVISSGSFGKRYASGGLEEKRDLVLLWYTIS